MDFLFHLNNIKTIELKLFQGDKTLFISAVVLLSDDFGTIFCEIHLFVFGCAEMKLILILCGLCLDSKQMYFPVS